MLTVHHLGISQSERIVWLCEELELEYDLVVYKRDPVTSLAPAEYKALHPMEIAPVITDDDVTLAESSAIIDYIVARYGAGRLTVSSADPAFADYLFWYHFANGTLMPSEMSAAGSRPGPESPLDVVLRHRAERAFGLLELRLKDATFLAGDVFTVADIMTVFPLTTMRAFSGRRLDDYPNIRAYLARIGARPAYRRAMAKGDPDLVSLLT